MKLGVGIGLCIFFEVFVSEVLYSVCEQRGRQEIQYATRS